MRILNRRTGTLPGVAALAVVMGGCDLVGLGVSSFSHVGGVHYQNSANWDRYLQGIGEERFPVERAFVPAERERLTRELILQMKLGHLDPGYFRKKFSVDVLDEFATQWRKLDSLGMLRVEDGNVRLTRQGLLRVDSLLPEFYAPEYQNARYT